MKKTDHIYEGAPYDEPDEQMVEITIERGKKDVSKVVKKEKLT